MPLYDSNTARTQFRHSRYILPERNANTPLTPICANGNDLQPQHIDNNLFDFSGFAKNIPNTQQVRVVATMTEPAIFANIFIKKMIVSETIFIEFPRIFTTFHPRKGIE